MAKYISFRDIAEGIREAEASREATITRAFEVLEKQYSLLACMLLQNIGDRQRAARWMCMPQRAFDGRTAYEVLAEGDVDSVWERVTGSGSVPVATPRVGGGS